MTSETRRQRATLGGGCFWCTEAVFARLRGVESVVSGFAGGDVENPAYQHVSSGTTGHAEVVQITFDPDVICYRDLLEVFFQTHDPTTINRQGNDIGTQYRSVIFYHDAQQRSEAEQHRKQLNESGEFDRPIVTRIEPYSEFYPAEAYHQDYFERHTEQAYCRYIIEPKLKKLGERFGERLK